jgi:Ca-activated chloride channel family protein
LLTNPLALNRAILSVLLLVLSVPLPAQYYVRGDVRDQQGQPLPNVKILLYSKGSYPYYSGSGGGFGIPTHLAIDTITFIAEGYETLKSRVISANYGLFALKMISTKSNSSKFSLSSVTKNLLTYAPYTPAESGESYSNTVENVFVETSQYPETGVALNVDRASYSNVRRFLNVKYQVPPEAVRIEELLNYFNFRSKKPGLQKEDFIVNTTLTSCPWNDENQLFFINLQAKKINLDKTPPSNLVFLIDVSGSMDMPNRLPLLKSAFKLLVENLRAIDTVSIITYGSDVAVRLQPTSGEEKQKIISAIEELTPAGATAGESAIRLAYTFAKNTFIKGGNNRVILATDGDFNVGATSEKDLEELITKQRQTGIYLTCLGVGMGNYKDSKLEILAKKGNGNFAYFDSEREAEKVLVEEFSQTLYTVANDVFLNINFNPSLVKEYKLLGFNNPQNSIADSSVQLEGGEIGSGHSLIVAFEIVPTQRNLHHDPSKNDNLAILNLAYKDVEKSTNKNIIVHAPFNYTDLQKADSSFRFASSVIMFGGLLKQCTFVKNSTWDDVRNLALTATSSDNLLQVEFLEMIQKAKKIYAAKKK